MVMVDRVVGLGRHWGRQWGRIALPWRRWWADQVFLVQLSSERLRPSRFGSFAGRLALARRLALSAASAAQTDVLLSAYQPLVDVHYGPGGRGYPSLGDLDDAAAAQRYATQGSRLRPFIAAYDHLLSYRDGQTFLDLGCGTGQNVRELLHRFPTSPVHGLDINADAIAFLSRVEGSTRLHGKTASFADPVVLREVLAEVQPDHVVICHALSTLYADSVESTRTLFTSILAPITTSSARSLVVIDSFAARGRYDITIEQRTRLRAAHDVLSLFDPLGAGRAHLVNADGLQAVIWISTAGGATQAAPAAG